MATRLRPPGFGAQARPLGDGARLSRGRSTLADAQRRYNAAADQDERLSFAHGAASPSPRMPGEGRGEGASPDAQAHGDAPSPDALTRADPGSSPGQALSPQAGRGEPAPAAGHGPTADERRRAAGWCGRPPGEVELSLLTHQARALYEAGVVPVRALARLCGVSLRTLYHHVGQQGWQRRRAAVPRDVAKSERRKARYRERKALEPPRPRGLKARDPAGHGRALEAVERAGALAGAALGRAIARQDAEARARIVANMARALRDVAIANDTVKKKRAGGEDGVKRRRPYQWRPHGTPPAWAERRR